MDGDESAQPASSSENDSEFAALLEAELEKDEWGEDEDEAAGWGERHDTMDNLEDLNNLEDNNLEDAKESLEVLSGAGEDSTESGICPPHPGYMWNICIRCGSEKTEDNDEKGVVLRYLHQGLELSELEADRLRKSDLQKLLAQKKLYLVVDLDHTLLNSTRMAEVPEGDSAYLRSAYRPALVHPPHPPPSTFSGDLLYELPPLLMWTKLRPFVRKFLEEAAGMFEMYVYTMGEKLYAQAMARLLDPTGRLFGERVISQQDSTSRRTKDLDVVLGAESACLIIDDTEAVWPKNRANLLVIERYHFFRSSRRQFGLPGESLVEAKKDECSKEGALRGILNTLKKVHTQFFKPQEAPADVRQVLGSVRRGILSGCYIVFSRIFPQGFFHHQSHPLWVRATELGATCSLATTHETTHVVTVDLGTEKARWAQQSGKFVVRPEWLDCCQLTWSRAREEDFPVLADAKSRTAAPKFARTVDRQPIGTSNGVEAGSRDLTDGQDAIPANGRAEDEDGPESTGRTESTLKLSERIARDGLAEGEQVGKGDASMSGVSDRGADENKHEHQANKRQRQSSASEEPGG